MSERIQSDASLLGKRSAINDLPGAGAKPATSVRHASGSDQVGRTAGSIPATGATWNARQRKFLSLASRDGGACPWDMPKGGPYLKNEEMRPLIDAGAVVWSDMLCAWVTPQPPGDAPESLRSREPNY